MLRLLLLSTVLATTHSCKCVPWNTATKLCEASNVVLVTILHYTDSQDSPYSGTRTARARVDEYLKGEGEVGEVLRVESNLSGAACGVGRAFEKGNTRVVLDPKSKSYAGMSHVSSCQGRLYYDVEYIRDLLDRVDCTCKRSRCKLREGRHVFRGVCEDPKSYCARDKKGVCRWKNVDTIDQCKRFWRKDF